MEMEEIHRHSCKRSRTNASAAAKVARHQDDEDDDGEQKIGGRGGGGPRLRPWQHPSSRIFRVSRASGGKDRHSKVLTAKGLRDRRVRLSVSTAIQFYDLQDRLGYDQPSKAIEWLIKAASSAISDLPSLDATFPEPPQHPRAEQEEQIDATEMEQEAEGAQQQHLSMSKSGCSSTSETSKGSVLSLSRSEIRVKARERARERAAKDRDKDDGGVSAAAHNHHGMSPSLNSQSSFTELLTGGGSCGNGAMHGQTSPSSNCVQKQQMHHLPPVTVTADYFGQATAGLFGQPLKHHSSQQQQQQQQQHGFLSQPPFSGGSPVMMPFNITMAGDHPETQQQQHFTLLPDHLVSVASSATGDYSFNLSISPGLTGYNRGTLQSNSPSQLPHHHFQRLAPPVDGSNLFFFGGAGNADNQFSAAATGFDGRPQLCYGDGYRHSDVKGKGKS